MSRGQAVMLLLVVLLGGFYVFQEKRQQSNTEAEEQAKRFFSNFEEDQVDRITIEPLEGEARVVVRRSGRWLTEADHPWLLDSVRLQRTADDLALLMHERELAQNPGEAELEDYGLKAPAYRISLKAGEEESTLLVGSRTPDGNQYYVQLAGQTPVYTVDALFADVVELPLAQLREMSPLPADPGDVTKLTIQRGDSRLELQSQKPEGAKTEGGDGEAELEWKLVSPAEALAQATRVRDYVWKWKSLKAGRVLDPGEEVEWKETVLKLEVWTDQEQPAVLEVGPAVPVMPAMRYVRRLDPEEVLVVDFTDTPGILEPDALTFRDRRVLAFEVDQVQAVEAGLPEMELVARRKSAHWKLEKPEGVEADEMTQDAAVSNFLWDLKRLEWDQEEGVDLGEVRATAKLSGDDGELGTIRIGATGEQGTAVASTDKVVLVTGDPVDSLLQSLEPLSASPEASPTPAVTP